MKIYIAGKITGDKDYKSKFCAAAKNFSPNEVILSPATLPKGMTRTEYMRICLAMIDSADKAAFIPDWKDSPGARVEHDYCRYIGKPVIYL